MVLNKKSVINIFLIILSVLFIVLYFITQKAYIIFDVDVEKNQGMTIYYDNFKSSYRFDEKHRTSQLILTPGKESIKIHIPKKNINYLRVDFDGPSTSIKLFKIEIKYNLMQKYLFLPEDIENVFSYHQEFSSYEQENNYIIYTTKGDSDSFIATTEPISNYQSTISKRCDETVSILLAILFFIFVRQIIKFFYMKLKNPQPAIVNWIIIGLTLLFYILSKGIEYKLLYFFFFSTIVLFFITSLKYIDYNKSYIKNIKRIALFFFIVMSPLILNGFFYFDDYWSVNFGNIINAGIGMRRPLMGLIAIPFLNLTFDSCNLFRLINILFLLLFVALLYIFLRANKSTELKAEMVCIVVFCSTIGVDLVAYLSIFPIIYALLFSLSAFINIDAALLFEVTNKLKINYLKLFSGIVLLLSSFCFYNIVTPIFFAFCVVVLLGEKKEIVIRKSLLLGTIYGMVTIIYLLFTSYLINLYDCSVAQDARSHIINSFPLLLGKIKWFVLTVIPQSFYKIGSVFLPSTILLRNNRFYKISFISTYIEKIIIIVFLVSIIYFVICLFRKKELFKALGVGISIPLTFYPFLLLPESSIMTYYMIPIVFLLSYCTIIAWSDILSRYCNIFKKYINIFILALVIMVGISYSNYWVIYNRDSYQFIKQSLINQINKETKIIYVNGKLSPGAGNPYVTFNVNNILKELGKNTNEYKVLQSDNNFLIAHITLENERSLRKKLSDDEYKKFMSYYKYSDYYSYYSFKEDSERVIDKDFMKKCLMVAELIPNEESREVAYINLSGFNEIHKF